MTLLDLADRFEALQGADRRLDAEIHSLVNRPGPDDPGRNLAIFDQVIARIRAGGDDDEVPRYTASIDMALTLVPEGFGWRLWMPALPQISDGDLPRVTIWGPARSYAPNDTEAATAALALCAAALRARAAAGLE